MHVLAEVGGSCHGLISCGAGACGNRVTQLEIVTNVCPLHHICSHFIAMAATRQSLMAAWRMGKCSVVEMRIAS